MLRIELKNGNVITYKGDSFTDYEWKKEAFIVIKGEQWIAIFNWESVRSVLYMEDKD